MRRWWLKNLKSKKFQFSLFCLCQNIFLLKSQIAISKTRGGRRKLPLVFTEQGVAMLSSVLNKDCV